MRRWEVWIWGVVEWLAVAGILAIAWMLEGWLASVAVSLLLAVLLGAIVITARER